MPPDFCPRFLPSVKFYCTPLDGPLLSHSNCCPFYIDPFASLKKSLCPKPLKAVLLLKRRSNSIQLISFLPCWKLFSGLWTKTAGLKPFLHQLTSLYHQLSEALEKYICIHTYIWDLLESFTGCGQTNITMLVYELKVQESRSHSVHKAGRPIWSSADARIPKK